MAGAEPSWLLRYCDRLLRVTYSVVAQSLCTNVRLWKRKFPVMQWLLTTRTVSTDL